MKILVTGGAGFVGSNLAISIKKKYPHYIVTCVDNLKRSGSELNLQRLKELNILFIHADIRNKEDLFTIPSFDILIDACADPSVLAGINSPIDQVINTNLIGTLNCLELAKKYNAGFIFLSTSRVYPIDYLNQIKYIECDTRYEWCDIKGIDELQIMEGSRSFYGFTKYSSELLIQEYEYYFNLKTIINRCGVIAGPGQMGKSDQGIITFWLAQHYWNRDLKYIGFNGSGKQVRDILYIDDLFDLVDYQIHNIDILKGDLYNVGGGIDSNISLLELTTLCNQITGNQLNIEKSTESRTGDVRIYITDNSKVFNKTGWSPKTTTNQIVEYVFNWIKNNENSLKNILVR